MQILIQDLGFSFCQTCMDISIVKLVCLKVALVDWLHKMGLGTDKCLETSTLDS